MLQNTPLPSFNGVDTVYNILVVAYVLCVRFYYVFLVIGLVVYASTLSDSAAKGSIIIGIVFYVLGNILGTIVDVENIALLLANVDFIPAQLLKLSDVETLPLVYAFGSAICAICVLVGAITYFTHLSPEMERTGKRLIVRSLIVLTIFVSLSAVIWLW